MEIANINRRFGARWFGKRTIWIMGSGLLLLILGAPILTSAITAISQGYSTSDDLSIGSIVSLKDNTSDNVVAATAANSDSIFGVVINNDAAQLTLSNPQAKQVQVATSGIVSVLISDINGKVKQGDSITASPIKGVGMKATSNVKVIGIAQGTTNQGDQHKQEYTDGHGAKQTVTLGEVPIAVNATYYFKTPDKTIVPAVVQNIANTLAGKKVNTIPIIISAAIFIITMIIVVIIIYSMIHSSIISVGRNPMSQSAIYRDMIQMSVLVLGILAVALIIIYIILTRL